MARTNRTVLIRLAHAELALPDLGAARAFYVDVLGFIVDHDTPDHLYLRGVEEFDRWSLKLTRSSTTGLVHFAFRVCDEESLHELVRQHARLGLTVTVLREHEEPSQGQAFRYRLPDGHAIEFFHQFDEVQLRGDTGIALPMRQTHQNCGIPPARLDHVNLKVPDILQSLSYYRGDLGLSMSEQQIDHQGVPLIAWLRARRGSHDVALQVGDRPAMHHLAYAVADGAAVLRVADLLADAGFADAIEFGPGRHGVSNAMTMYARDPAGHRLEFYSGDYERDHDREPLTWTTEEYERNGRMWWGDPPPQSFRTETTSVVGEATSNVGTKP